MSCSNMCLKVKSCSCDEGVEGGKPTTGIWFAPRNQRSDHVATAVVGIVDQAASHEHNRFAVTRPAESHLSGLFLLNFILNIVLKRPVNFNQGLGEGRRQEGRLWS